MYTILLSVFFRGRSGFLNSPLEIFSHKTSSGLNSFTCLASKMARLKLSNSVFFGSSLLIIDRATMPVVSDPCSCQSDCFVCGRGEEPPHDCAIHVLLESMVFQEQILHGEPTEAKLEESLKNGKIFTPRHAYDGRK
ncbi:uncharacterized protein TNCV_2431261 [Trichonephila clavipes]|nr:uncharacterized protein TNCV_2431261 [Trichonephila clavipes]